MKIRRFIPYITLVLFLSLSGNSLAITNPNVTTQAVTDIGTNNVTGHGTITDFGSYNNLTAGFDYWSTGSHTQIQETYHVAGTQYPTFNNKSSMANGDASHLINNATLFFNTVSGGTQIAIIVLCTYVTGVQIYLSGFTTIIDYTSSNLICGAGVRIYMGSRLSGGQSSSFIATFSPSNSVWGVTFSAFEYIEVALIDSVITQWNGTLSTQQAITRLTPAKTNMFAVAINTNNRDVQVAVEGHLRDTRCESIISFICIGGGDNENSDMTNSSNKQIKFQYLTSQQIEWVSVFLHFYQTPIIFSKYINGLLECTIYYIRSYVSPSNSSSPIAYGNTISFITIGTCPVNPFFGWVLIMGYIALMTMFVVSAYKFGKWRMSR